MAAPDRGDYARASESGCLPGRAGSGTLGVMCVKVGVRQDSLLLQLLSQAAEQATATADEVIQ
jgi:uncharacterized NAD-dependent epimerase/dehydratase family protein